MISCHRRFVRYDLDAACREKSMPSLVFVFARQALNQASDIQLSDAVEETCKVYIDAEDRKMYMLRRQQWQAPTGLPV